MDHLRRLGDSISIPLLKDETGFVGRECPHTECKGYFKVEFGTGLKGEDLPCFCPYCGYVARHDHFLAKEQIEYVKSFAIQEITNALYKDLKNLEFDHKPKGAFGIGISLKFEPGRRMPIHYYREKKLETEITCVNCTLRYSVYGIFAFCPDCGQHNSLQILDKNLEVIEKMLALATKVENIIAEKLIENALEDCVSTFDGFGRELCKVFANKARNPGRAQKMNFQNLEGAKRTFFELFGIDLASKITPEEWQMAMIGFQKRHLLSHKLGIVDHDYVKKSDDLGAVVGRRTNIEADEVRGIVLIIRKLATCLSDSLQKMTENIK